MSTGTPDIDRIRADTPACLQITHFNNAGCSLSPTPVIAAVLEHLQLEQQIGGYEAAQQAHAKIQNFYQSLSLLLNCQPDEVAFVENATRAWELALYSIPLEAGDQIITGSMEYASNYLGLLHLAKQRQIEIVLVDSDAYGQIDLQALQQAINGKTRLIALTHIASHRGDVQPAAAVGRIAREHGLYYLLDACQSSGQIRLDVRELGCDFLCASGRKYLRGPRGSGFLYLNKSRTEELEPVFIDLHAAQWLDQGHYRLQADARRFETWERFVAGQIGLGCAVDYACQIGLDTIEARIAELTACLREALQDVTGVSVHEKSTELSGIVTFSRQGETAASIQQRLQAASINSSVSKQANAQLDLAKKGLGDVNRLSLHYYNNVEEIMRLVRVIEDN